MATKYKYPRYALGFLFVATAVLIPLKIFETEVVRFLSPYMGGQAVCPGGKPVERVTAFGPEDSCFRISQSADNLVNTVEVGLIAFIVVLSCYVLFRGVVRLIGLRR